ncbi:unnamed protein product, partial [Mesorhabditis belari]|uniref:VWFA domain-containing protein n=1 Tax=Mesorhabditis belari TaxID=2138241 RepID=A0AAF3EYT7_9BILA
MSEINSIVDLSTAVYLNEHRTRVLLGTYDSQLNFPDQHFNVTANANSFLTQIIKFMYSGYMGYPGNDLDGLFNFVLSLNMRNVMRSSTRKMLVYFTSAGIGDDSSFQDLLPLVYHLRAVGVEIFPIAYGKKANIVQAKKISPRCARWVETPWDLDDTIKYLLSNLCS